jgi:hypothetical protein
MSREVYGEVPRDRKGQNGSIVPLPQYKHQFARLRDKPKRAQTNKSGTASLGKILVDFDLDINKWKPQRLLNEAFAADHPMPIDPFKVEPIQIQHPTVAFGTWRKGEAAIA